MKAAKLLAPVIFCLVLAASALPSPGQSAPAPGGRLWVVDQAAPQADDGGPGTEEKPFRTIAQAAKKAGPGDTVCVMESNYAEKIVIPASASGAAGQAARKTVFRAAPPQSVQVQGFEIARAGHVRIEGFHVVQSGVLGTWGDGVEVVGNLIEVQTYGVDAGAGSPRNCLVAANRVFKPQSGFIISGRDWIVERNEIERLQQYDKRDSDYSRAFGDGHIIRRNYYHGARAEEIGTAHTDGCQTWHLKAQPGSHLRGVTFEDNVFLNIGQGIIARNEEEANFLGAFTCRRNIFGIGMGTAPGGKMPNGAWGFCLQNVYGLTAENNLVLKCIHGIGMWGNGVLVAKNNITWDTGTSIWAAGAERGDSPFAGTFTAKYNLVTSTRSKLDDTNLVKDPMFVDANAGNYRLRKGSPAIGAGEGNVTIGPLEYPNVYWVDPTHPAADDGKFGYAAIPFKTAARAAEVAEPGETILLCAGVYRETITLKKDGITIRAAGRRGADANGAGMAAAGANVGSANAAEKVVISGADLITGWKRDAAGGWSAPLAAAPTKVLRDGNPWTGFTYDAASKRIVVKAGDPRLRTIETVVREKGIDLAGHKDVKIEGVEEIDLLRK